MNRGRTVAIAAGTMMSVLFAAGTAAGSSTSVASKASPAGPVSAPGIGATSNRPELALPLAKAQRPVLAPDGTLTGMPTKTVKAASAWVNARVGKSQGRAYYCDVTAQRSSAFTWSNFSMYIAYERLGKPASPEFWWGYKVRSKGTADPLKLRTARGVGLGSTIAQVSKAYGVSAKPAYDYAGDTSLIGYVIQIPGRKQGGDLTFWFKRGKATTPAHEITSGIFPCGE